MKRLQFLSIFVSLLFVASGTLFADLDRHSTTAAAVDGAATAIDSSGNIFHAISVKSADQIIVTKTDKYGDLDTGFGTSGVLTLTFVNVGGNSSGTNININNFSAIIGSLRMVIDGNDKIILGGIVDRTSGNNQYFLIRLSGSTGALDSSFSSDGVAPIIAVSPGANDMDDLIVDGTNRPIFCSYVSPRPYVVRRSSSGATDGSLYISSTHLSNGQRGPKLAVDSSNNVYVVGKYGASSPNYGIFATKLNESDLSTNTSFASGTNNIYASGDIGLDTNSVVFPMMVGGALILYSVQNGGVNVVIRSLNLATGAEEASATTASVFPSAVVLNSMIAVGVNLYIGGTINSGGETAFIGRIHGTTFVGDVTFATSGDDNYIANGIVKLPVTSGASIASGDGGYVSYRATSPATVAAGFKETDGGTTRFIRIAGVEGAHFLEELEKPITPSATVGAAVSAAGKARRDLSFSHIAVSGTNLSNVDDGGVMVTGYDDVVTFFRSGKDFIFTVMDEQGALETDFGTSGASKIQMKSSGASATVAAVTNFSAVTANKPSYMDYDMTNNIVLACQADITGGTKQVVIMRIKNGVTSGAGELDTTFNSTGVATLAASSATHQVEGVKVDAQGRILVLVYHANGGTTTAHLYRFASNGIIDGTFGSGGKVDLSSGSLMTNAQIGLSLAIDHQDNAYVAGQYNDSGSRGLFCVKAKASDGSVDTANFATSGTAGLFKTAALSELDGSNMQTFTSIYEYDDIQNIQVTTRGTSGANSGIVIQQLNVSDGTADTTFGVSGKVFTTIPNLTTLNDVERNEEGHLFCGGTITESAVVKTFLARFKDSGELDDHFGDSSGSTKTGIAKLDATATWTITDGGFFFIDSGGAVPIAHIESKGANRQLIVQRIPGTDDFDFDVTKVDNGEDLNGFILTHHLNSIPALKGLIHLDGIVADLQADWEAVGGVLDAAAIAKGVKLFRESMEIVLGFTVARASKNSFGSCLALPNKSGPMNKKMQKLMNKVENSFTSAQLNAMDAGVNAAFEKVFSRLNGGRHGATGNKRKKQKTQ